MRTNISEWFRPKNITEAVEIIKSGHAIPYAGGTGLRNGQVHGLIDLRGLNLDYIREKKNSVAIGACTRFNDISHFHWSDERRILSQAVGQAASNPLRNLITLGGSLAYRPVWSNIPTALLALNASIIVTGTDPSEYSVADFLKVKHSRQFLITEIVLPPAPGYGFYYRFARTRFDYSALDLAIYVEIKSGMIDLCRVAVGNALPVASRLTNIENQLIGMQLSNPKINEIVSSAEIKPLKNPNFSREFILNILKTELVRAFTKIREQDYAN